MKYEVPDRGKGTEEDLVGVGRSGIKPVIVFSPALPYTTYCRKAQNKINNSFDSYWHCCCGLSVSLVFLASRNQTHCLSYSSRTPNTYMYVVKVQAVD